MIRRDPTLIPMTDNDVQDVRDMLAARQKAQSLQKTEEMLRDGATGVPGFAAQEDAKRKKDTMSKHERLGL